MCQKHPLLRFVWLHWEQPCWLLVLYGFIVSSLNPCWLLYYWLWHLFLFVWRKWCLEPQKNSKSASAFTIEVVEVLESSHSCYSLGGTGLVSLPLVICEDPGRSSSPLSVYIMFFSLFTSCSGSGALNCCYLCLPCYFAVFHACSCSCLFLAVLASPCLRTE